MPFLPLWTFLTPQSSQKVSITKNREGIFMKDHFKLSGEQQEVLVAILVVKAGSQSKK